MTTTAKTLRRLLCSAMAIFAVIHLTPAQAQMRASFGRIIPGAVPSNGLTGDFKRASKFTLPTAGTIIQLCAYLDGKGGVSDAQTMHLVLYRDANGVPGTKVVEGNGNAFLGGDAAYWSCEPVAFTAVPAGQYWIAIHTAAPTGVIRDFTDAGGNWCGNADAFADGAANTFGSCSAGSGTLTVYADYFPDSQLRNAGRMTIGSKPSSGMTANFKRGSMFVLPERGKLSEITTYLDGGGTTVADEQPYRMVIYKDSNGVPGERLYQSTLQGGIRTSWPGRWYTEMAYPGIAPTLDAGRYWIAIHTGPGSENPAGGVIRNFADATGQWYGNSDAYVDGASTPFGPGAAGAATISSFISYRPGTITTGQLGRTDIATIPSKGLTPNVSRMSRFVMTDRSATVTDLYAYLDGLGATSGSQPVRMVLYATRVEEEDHNKFAVFYKIAESNPVTIAAGMQPRWVRFPVAAAPISDDVPPLYFVALQSGGSTAVARDYGDARSGLRFDWNSMTDAFADGGVASFTDEALGPTGDTTLSVYANYTLPPP